MPTYICLDAEGDYLANCTGHTNPMHQCPNAPMGYGPGPDDGHSI